MNGERDNDCVDSYQLRTPPRSAPLTALDRREIIRNAWTGLEKGQETAPHSGKESMSALNPSSLDILGVVGSTEQSLLTQAAALLSECLPAGCAARVTCHDAVRSDFLSPDAPPIPEELYDRGLVPAGWRTHAGPLYQPGRRVVVLSLLADVQQTALRHRRERYLFLPLPGWQRGWTEDQRRWVAAHFVEEPPLTLEAVSTQWGRILPEVQRACGAGSVFLCNVFRHVPGRLPLPSNGRLPSLRERIRRMNLIAADLSHQTGISIVDLDRGLARHGGRELHTDYRLLGDSAAAAGAAILVSTLFRAGLDEHLAPEVQEKALACYEARQAALDFYTSRSYTVALREFFEAVQLKAGGRAEWDAPALLEFGTFLLKGADMLKAGTSERHLSIHRLFIVGLRELGHAHIDLSRALSAKDAVGLAQARERIRKGDEQLGVFWKALHDFSKASAPSAGGGIGP